LFTRKNRENADAINVQFSFPAAFCYIVVTHSHDLHMFYITKILTHLIVVNLFLFVMNPSAEMKQNFMGELVLKIVFI